MKHTLALEDDFILIFSYKAHQTRDSVVNEYSIRFI